MNRRLNRTNRNYIIIGLCMILVIMGVGYAAFQSQLKISGTSNIGANFNVRITGIQSSVQNGSASDAQTPTHDDTTATFKTNLVSPGDSMKYDITVANEGTIDAVLESIEVNDGNNPAITFQTSGIEEGDELQVSQSDILTVIVSYDSNVTSQPESTNSTITVTLNYIQTEESVIPPEPEKAAEQLKKLVTTTGDGLYRDEYEEGRYIYKGTNPNNYITFNNELWRIISVEKDGTIKLIRNESLEEQSWDNSSGCPIAYNGVVKNKNETVVENIIYTAPDSGSTLGCNDWLRPATLNTYLNNEYYNTLTTNAQSQIVSYNWKVGKVEYDNNDLSAQIESENGTTWNGKIGLITASEYLRANSNIEQCGTFSLSGNNKETCSTTNWLLSNVKYWTISATTNTSLQEVCLIYLYELGSDFAGAKSAGGESNTPRPSLYITSSITVTGSGTELDPYQIVE